MDIKKFKKVTPPILNKYMRLFDLFDWDITWGLQQEIITKKSDGCLTYGECLDADWKYKTARIVLYASPHNTEEEIINTVKHEIGHVMHAPLEHVYYQFMSKELRKNKAFKELESIAMEHMATMIANIKI